MKPVVFDVAYGPKIKITETNTLPELFNGEPVFSSEIIVSVGLSYFYRKKDGNIGIISTKQYRKRVPKLSRWFFMFKIYVLKLTKQI